MVKDYEDLKKLYYKKFDIDEEYKKRLENFSSIVTNLKIFSQYKKEEIPLFYVLLPYHLKLIEKI